MIEDIRRQITRRIKLRATRSKVLRMPEKHQKVCLLLYFRDKSEREAAEAAAITRHQIRKMKAFFMRFLTE